MNKPTSYHINGKHIDGVHHLQWVDKDYPSRAGLICELPQDDERCFYYVGGFAVGEASILIMCPTCAMRVKAAIIMDELSQDLTNGS